jgi:hypothetical protein
MPAVTAAMSSLLHHLAVDQLERLGRDGDFAPKGMIEQDDQADHGASEGGDQSSKQQMSAEGQVEQPNQEHVDQRANRDRIPHDGRYAGGDAENAVPSILKEVIELAQRCIVESFR